MFYPEGISGKSGPLFVMVVDGTDRHAIRALAAYAISVGATDSVLARAIAEHIIKVEDIDVRHD